MNAMAEEITSKPESKKVNSFRWEGGVLKKNIKSEATHSQELEIVDPAIIIKPEEAAHIQKDVEAKQKEGQVKELADAFNELMKIGGKPEANEGTIAIKSPESLAYKAVEEIKTGELEQLAESVNKALEHRSQHEVMQALLSINKLQRFYEELDRMKEAGETIKFDDGTVWDGELIRSKVIGAEEARKRNGPIGETTAFLMQIPAGGLRDKVEELLKIRGWCKAVEKLEATKEMERQKMRS